jgi:hypothetical protein
MTEDDAFVADMRVVFGEASEHFGESLVEMLRDFWSRSRVRVLSKRCRFFFVPGVLVPPDTMPRAREQCGFPDGHEGPHSFD